MAFGIKRTPGDIAFSNYVRYVYEGICQRCLGQFEIFSKGYQCSHFWGRGNKSVRFDFENVTALCGGCHSYFGANPHEHQEFFLKRLGKEKYDALARRAHTPHPGKVDDKAMKMGFKLKLEELRASRSGESFWLSRNRPV